MGQPIARLGDTSNHGGSIIGGSGNVRSDGAAVSREGDVLLCPLHGPRTIASVSNGSVRVNGLKILTVGAVASCGAIIVSGSPKARSG